MRVPSLKALQSLEELARQGSMQRVSKELNLTPSAISHQLRQLEAELGAPVIVRDGKGVAFTEFGKRYVEEVRKALSLIKRAGDLTNEIELSGRLSISCTPCFAIFWLFEQLADFRRLYPKIELNIVTPQRLDSVDERSADVFIAFGTGNWQDMKTELLAEIEFAPYCSPRLVEACGGKLSLDQIDEVPLLHVANHDDWIRWSNAIGRTFNAQRGILFSGMHLVLSAAISGLGLAMGDNITCRAAVRHGQLVMPFSHTVRSIESFYLVSKPEVLGRPVCRVFRDWIIDRRDSIGRIAKYEIDQPRMSAAT